MIVTRYAVQADQLFDGHRLHRGGGVLIRHGRIEALFDRDATASIEAPVDHVAGLLAPGFIDLQVNGGGGTLFNNAPSLAGLETIAIAHRALGTTSLLPTLISPTRPLFREAADKISKSIEEFPSKSLRILGVHVEGPHLNPARAGAHARSALRPLEAIDLELLKDLSTGVGSTLITVAPERVSIDAIETLSNHGARVFAGHTEASASEFAAAKRAGLVGVTHLFNAMPPLTNRAPGVVGAALADGDVFCGVIADGVHVDWVSFRAAFAALGPERLFLVSDAMPPVGERSPAESAHSEPFSLGGPLVRTSGSGDGRHCVLPDGTLAGSCLSISAALRNVVRHAGVSLESALQMASTTPAAALGRSEELGALAPGAWADLVLLDSALVVQGVWVGGRRATPTA